MSPEDLELKQKVDHNEKVANEIIDKIFLLLKGLSYRRSRNILAKAQIKLSDRATLHTEPLSDKN